MKGALYPGALSLFLLFLANFTKQQLQETNHTMIAPTGSAYDQYLSPIVAQTIATSDVAMSLRMSIASTLNFHVLSAFLILRHSTEQGTLTFEDAVPRL